MVVTGRDADEILLVALLYVLNVVNFASCRGVGCVGCAVDPRCLILFNGLCKGVVWASG